jgi:hypothetical protein
MVGVDLPKGIHHICIAVQTEDLFLCPANGELAMVLNVFGICEVESAEAGLG